MHGALLKRGILGDHTPLQAEEQIHGVFWGIILPKHHSATAQLSWKGAGSKHSEKREYQQKVMSISKECWAEASVRSPGCLPLLGKQAVWITRMQEEAWGVESVLYCIFMAVTTGCPSVFFFPEGLCFSWLILPVPLCRATPSSCSTTTATPRSCPCGCAGCWRSGDPRDHSELCGIPRAPPGPGSPALDSQFIQIMFYSKYSLEASTKSGYLLAAFSH